MMLEWTRGRILHKCGVPEYLEVRLSSQVLKSASHNLNLPDQANKDSLLPGQRCQHCDWDWARLNHPRSNHLRTTSPDLAETRRGLSSNLWIHNPTSHRRFSLSDSVNLGNIYLVQRLPMKMTTSVILIWVTRPVQQDLLMWCTCTKFQVMLSQ
jgi:hypothetical protein